MAESESKAKSGAVVVGVDGSAESEEALAFALRTAALREESVRVIGVVPPVDMWALGYGMGMLPTVEDLVGETRHAAEATVKKVVAEVGASVDDVPVEIHAVVGVPSQALVDAATNASQLVVGHRGRGAVSSALLGSVGLACVLHAPCPVTVVRAPESD